MRKSIFLLTILFLMLLGCNSSKNMQALKLGPNPFVTHIFTADPSAHD